MRNVANESLENLKDLFQEVARQTRRTPGVVEKDFWACWMLDYLFCQSNLGEQIEFKGGTSLSKVYGIIDRFSEDIDLTLDWRLIGCEDSEMKDERTPSQNKKFSQKVNERLAFFLREKLVQKIVEDIAKILVHDCFLRLGTDKESIEFHYPRHFEEASLLQHIRLEFGAKGNWEPFEMRQIEPYAAKIFPEKFDIKSVNVRTVTSERTFWEKATILHKEAFRENGIVPLRYSRHYYDLYQYTKGPLFESALMRIDLLESVAQYKTRFFYAKNAHYELARKGSLKLSPPKSSIKALSSDYLSMKNMINGDYPQFEKILEKLVLMENQINGCD